MGTKTNIVTALVITAAASAVITCILTDQLVVERRDWQIKVLKTRLMECEETRQAQAEMLKIEEQ